MAVEIKRENDVWTIINNRPEARNAGDPESADALVAAFDEFERSDAKVAVFWGAGGAFCAGWDLKYAASLADPMKFENEIVEGLSFPVGSAPAPRGPLGPTRMELSKPVIGALEGPAVAGATRACGDRGVPVHTPGSPGRGPAGARGGVGRSRGCGGSGVVRTDPGRSGWAFSGGHGRNAGVAAGQRPGRLNRRVTAARRFQSTRH